MAEKKSGAQRGEWSIPSITQLESWAFLSQPVSRAPLPHSLSPLLSAFMSLERDLKRQALGLQGLSSLLFILLLEDLVNLCAQCKI